MNLFHINSLLTANVFVIAIGEDLNSIKSYAAAVTSSRCDIQLTPGLLISVVEWNYNTVIFRNRHHKDLLIEVTINLR